MNTPINRFFVLLVVSALAVGGLPQKSKDWITTAAWAQQDMISTAERPDVQIMALPHPTGQWSVTAVYPAPVTREKAEAHLRRLLAVTGWKGNSVAFENRSPESGEAQGGGALDGGALSSMTFLTGAPLVDAQKGTLAVEPFARAYRDLSRIHVTYLLPGGFTFRGLRRYSDPNIEVAFSGGRNSYTYRLTIKNPETETFGLPKFDTGGSRAASAVSVSGPSGRARTRRLLGTGLVVLAAVGAGLGAYILASRARGGGSGGSSGNKG